MITKLEELLQRSSTAGARLRARGELLQPDELADPVIDMDHEVANLEVAQVGQKRLGEAAPLLRGTTFLFEDIRLGVDLQRRVGKTESSRQRPDSDEHCCCMGSRRLRPAPHDVVVAKNLDGALGATGAVGDEQHRVAALSRVSRRRSNRRRARGTPSPAARRRDGRRSRPRARALPVGRPWSSAVRSPTRK